MSGRDGSPAAAAAAAAAGGGEAPSSRRRRRRRRKARTPPSHKRENVSSMSAGASGNRQCASSSCSSSPAPSWPRKRGLHCLAPEGEQLRKLRRDRTRSKEEVAKEEEEEEDMEPVPESSALPPSSMTATTREAVETFLDDNSDFLEDYVRRKVHRTKLEGWLFGVPTSGAGATAMMCPPAASSNSSSNSSSRAQSRKNTLPTLSTSPSTTGLPPSFPSASSVKRQRSRSFTPLRRLSATKFEEGGLSTPILIHDVDGQPTFLRTSPKTSSGGNSGASFDGARRSSSSASSSAASFSLQQQQQQQQQQHSLSEKGDSLSVLLEEMFQEEDVPGVVVRAGRALRSLTGCHRASFLLTQPGRPFSGDLHTVEQQKQEGGEAEDEEEDFYSVRKCSAGRIATGVITSRQVVLSDHGGDDMEEEGEEGGGGRPAVASLTAPLFGPPHPATPLGPADASSNASSSSATAQQVIGAVQLSLIEPRRGGGSKKRSFTTEDEAAVTAVSRFIGLAVGWAAYRRATRLELARSEVFLELAHTVFGEQGRIEPTIRAILSSFLTVIDCERCQILLTDTEEGEEEDEGREGMFRQQEKLLMHRRRGQRREKGGASKVLFRRVFDLQRSDLDEEGNILGEEESSSTPMGSEGRFPINVFITGEVAATGKKINIRDARTDERFDQNVNGDSGGLTHRTLLCLPVRYGPHVLGVVSLINKEPSSSSSSSSSSSFFTQNDERFAEAFALFCGAAIRNAKEYERALLSEARLSVAFDVMNYQASAPEEDARLLASSDVPSAAAIGVRDLAFSYLGMSDDDTYKATIRMFLDLGLLSHFSVDYPTFCRWVLTVRRNYRSAESGVPYHNWHHAFNVAQMMFAMIRSPGAKWDQQFSKIEVLGLMVACLSHDLDHRGTTNSFQIKTKNPLATLYASSTLERHHLNQCLLLLNIPGNRILENVNEDDYAPVLSVIERCILATDLAQHFRHLPDITDLAARCRRDRKQANLACDKDRHTLQALLMTAADLGAVTKPWAVHLHVSRLIAAEFWAQGDAEREMGLTGGQEQAAPVAPMMDREAPLALVQIDFIDGICAGVYSAAEDLSAGALKQLRRGVVDNRRRWEEEERKREGGSQDEKKEGKEEGGGGGKDQGRARNL